jgi:hypothetical protein
MHGLDGRQLGDHLVVQMMFTADVALVACVKTKADHPVPAKDLYVSPWFRMARAYAERRSEL